MPTKGAPLLVYDVQLENKTKLVHTTKLIFKLELISHGVTTKEYLCVFHSSKTLKRSGKIAYCS